VFHIRALRNILCLYGNLKYDSVGKVEYNSSLKYSCVCLCVPIIIQKEWKTHFELIYDLQLHHACSYYCPKHIALSYLATIHTTVTSDLFYLVLHKTSHILTLLYVWFWSPVRDVSWILFSWRVDPNLRLMFLRGGSGAQWILQVEVLFCVLHWVTENEAARRLPARNCWYTRQLESTCLKPSSVWSRVSIWKRFSVKPEFKVRSGPKVSSNPKSCGSRPLYHSWFYRWHSITCLDLNPVKKVRDTSRM